MAILGAGITGLAAAYRLARERHAGAPVDEFVLEAASRPGGLIQTERVEGFVIEGGPDSFLTEKPEALGLVKELGLESELVGSNDAVRRTYILHHGRLVPLPEGLSLFVPRRLAKAVFSPLVPLASKLAVLREVLIRPGGGEELRRDEPVSWFVERHFGRGLLENIAEPLLAGIYGADVDRLSAQAALPSFYALERAYGSLTRGVLMSRERRPDQPLFTTLQGGMEDLVRALAARQDEPRSTSERRLLLGERVLQIDRFDSGAAAYRIQCESGAALDADAVISALPAPQIGELLSRLSPSLAQKLDSIRYTPAVTVSLAYSRLRVPRGFGFLVPAKAKRSILACTFVHGKFPGRAPAGAALLRCFLGGAREPGVIQMGETELLALVERELRSVLGRLPRPEFHRIYRRLAAMPQYHVGHPDLVRAIESEMHCLPGLFVAGNGYSGVGISDCIRTANAAAEHAVEYARARAAGL